MAINDLVLCAIVWNHKNIIAVPHTKNEKKVFL